MDIEQLDAKARGEKTSKAIEKLIQKEKAARNMVAADQSHTKSQDEHKKTLSVPWKWVLAMATLLTGYYVLFQ